MIAGTALAIIKFWLNAGQKAIQVEKRAVEAEETADKAHEKITILQVLVNAYQVTQAERLVSREALREVEERLSGSIDQLRARLERLGEKLDGPVKELSSHRAGGPASDLLCACHWHKIRQRCCLLALADCASNN
ncbi:hypothetical protein [Microvirga sp. TS319]|uniref:hypothetical protein n=1 Tax=Microvirga sp. TS319 TaxID=3241165 RepID=UPI00351A896A